MAVVEALDVDGPEASLDEPYMRSIIFAEAGSIRNPEDVPPGFVVIYLDANARPPIVVHPAGW